MAEVRTVNQPSGARRDDTPQDLANESRRLADAVWETLRITNPEGVDRGELESVAASVGIPLGVLLAQEPESEDREAGGQSATPAGVLAVDGKTRPANLANLVLLSTPPHTDVRGATSLNETFRSALHNLAANRTRGLLTMLGIIIGVFAVVVLQAVGNGLIGYTDSITGDYGGNNVTIQPARLISNGLDTGTLRRSLSLADAEALAAPGAVPDAMAVSPTASSKGLVHAGDANFSTTVIGVWPDYLIVGGYTLTSGNFVTSDDVNNRSLVVVLGANPAHALFGNDNPIGQTVWVDGVALRVIGLMKAQASIIGGGDDQIYVPLSTAFSRIFGGQPSTTDGSKSLDSIIIRAQSSSTIAAVQDESTSLLMARHQIGNGQPDFAVSSLLSALEQRAQILAAMNAFMVVVAGISLLVGGIGIMNIMLVSVTERTHEIGLRKAIGARSRDILNQFLMEAGLISLVGAGIGVGCALLLVLVISAVWRPCPPSVVGTIAAVVAALGTGLFFGVSPAKRAAALQPIEALRAE
ncbi:MAG TPA: ABC transporter permease [Dehalococcoidia bacterium]|nr:ABC transporter permease [Dehalococcoidia bacterium]